MVKLVLHSLNAVLDFIARMNLGLHTVKRIHQLLIKNNFKPFNFLLFIQTGNFLSFLYYKILYFGKIHVRLPLFPSFVHNGQTFFLPQFHLIFLWHIQMRDIDTKQFNFKYKWPLLTGIN
ncbi:unnamed protein product [Meloidogyne enterolobii]|uniref:Uncharacterized protein n=1 Tax=Meloidogyne enterolobii TaxID=390850 RepID=A0ACB0ZGE3_MELEN